MAGTLLLRNGTVIDGTGARGRRADIFISDDRIERIEPRSRATADITIDATDKVVAPGFIDTHSHADGGLLEDPTAETQIRQGITTAIVGQDGGSAPSLAEWFARVSEKRVALNIASFVGHGSVRRVVLGSDFKRAATADEIRKMRALVAREMKAGALGLSSGLEYDPGIYSNEAELIAVAEVAGIYGGLYISHMRDEETDALKSIRELIDIAERAHLPAQISHIKLAAQPVWGKTGDVFRLMDEARSRGLDITADIYPYPYWQSNIAVLSPSRDWTDRKAWESGLGEIGGAPQVRITSFVPDPSWEGKTLAEICQQTSKDAITQISEMALRSEGKASVVVTAMQEADIRSFMRDRRVMFCTDGGLRGSHPRGAGSYPRVLGRYVREQHVLSLEEAIRKMSSLPAQRMGLKDRGILAPGKKADLVIFDPRTVLDKATVQDPRAQPVGLTDVIVNGQPVLREGRITGTVSGQVLRRAGSR
jgi:N-acyl-D-amino-acid deacylase